MFCNLMDEDVRLIIDSEKATSILFFIHVRVYIYDGLGSSSVNDLQNTLCFQIVNFGVAGKIVALFI